MNDYEEFERPGVTRKQRKTRECIITTIILTSLVLLLIVIIIFVIVWWPKEKSSFVGYYSRAAVATDSPECSTVGKNILLKNGSAADAAIASLFCVGVRNLQGCGIGGGFFLIIYDYPKNGGLKEMLIFDAREVAPLGSSEQMFSNGSSTKLGGLSIAVPGEVKGFWEVWKKFGQLPWADLITPTIKVCREGFRVGPPLAKGIVKKEDLIRNSVGLSEILLNNDGSLKKEGDTVKLRKLADTLDKIALNPGEFYEGNLAQDIVDDIREAGGVITNKDLSDYKVVIKKAYTVPIYNSNLTLHSLPPPASGPVLGFMLNLLDGYNLTMEDVDGLARSALTYHRIIESFKFGYAMKTYLGDEDFSDLSQVLTNLSSPDFLDHIRDRITSDKTHSIEYYDPQPDGNHINDGGTCHISIIAPNGGAVSATASINLEFGSGVIGQRTGIIFNDEMDDFTIPAPGKVTHGKENFILPGKRPLSSMAPSIILDGNDNVRLVIGGSGGTEITTAMHYVIAHNLWLGFNINEAIDKYRLHHQLFPDVAQYEKGFNLQIVEQLRKRGHNIIDESLNSLVPAVQAVESTCDLRVKGKGSVFKEKCLIAVSDHRKFGKPDGF